jgi:hypothetical protein
MNIPIGVANSVSANFSYDPRDAYHYARQEKFELLQVYLTESMLAPESDLADWLMDVYRKGELPVYFHLPGDLNRSFFTQPVWEKLKRLSRNGDELPVIVHFDETAGLEEMLEGVERFAQSGFRLYLENYFRLNGAEAARKNLKKYLALFTLANARQVQLWPVLDLPRCFNARLQFSQEEALNWCYQLLNYFGNHHLPLLLHLIDVREAGQSRSSFCTIGQGIIPYPELFRFVRRNQIPLKGIVLEYEDKLHPLESRPVLQQWLSR